MKPQYLITLCFALLCNTAFAQPASTYWCNAPWPPPAGSDRTMGKDSDGHTCVKIAKEMPPTAPPVPAKPETAIVPKEGATVQPAKDLLRSRGNVEGISVTLSTNAKGEPVLSAVCEKGETGINHWDVQMYKMGYHQVHTKIGDTVVTSYEKK